MFSIKGRLEVFLALRAIQCLLLAHCPCRANAELTVCKFKSIAAFQ